MYIILFSQFFPKDCIAHFACTHLNPQFMVLAETSTFGIFRGRNARGRNVRAETSVAEMSGPKRPWPKCPWPKCPSFVADPTIPKALSFPVCNLG